MRKLCGWIAVGAVVALLFGCAASTAPRAPGQVSAAKAPYRINQPDTLPAKLQIPLTKMGGHIVVQAAVNGQPVGPFLFDTGSNVNGIDVGVAGELKLPKLGWGDVLGVGGHQAYFERQIQSISIGRQLGLPVDRLVGLNLLAFNEATQFNAAGIIGYQALHGVAFQIDVNQPRLTIFRPGALNPPTDAMRGRLFHFRGLPMIRATLAGGHPLFLIIDTGADKALYLPSECLTDWPGILGVPETGPGRSTGIGGSVGGKQAWIRSLRLFNLDLHDVPTAFEDGQPVELDGRLVGRIGNRLLQHMVLTFSRDRSTIWATWRAD